jgi:uncharacterized membrane protein
MSRLEFIKELERLLAEIAEEERAEALFYYENYFEDAGPEREQEILEQLGSPEKIAANIKAELGNSSNNERSTGYFTERGYEDDSMKDPKFEVIQKDRKEKETYKQKAFHDHNQYSNGNQYTNSGNDKYANYDNYNPVQENTKKNSNNSGMKVILIIAIIIFALPIGLPIIVTIFSLLIALGAAVFGIWIAFVAISIALTFAGIVATFAGIFKLVTAPIIGVSVAGMGLLLFGIGVLFIIVTVWLTTKVIPAMFKFIIDIFRLPFKNRRVAA